MKYYLLGLGILFSTLLSAQTPPTISPLTCDLSKKFGIRYCLPVKVDSAFIAAMGRLYNPATRKNTGYMIMSGSIDTVRVAWHLKYSETGKLHILIRNSRRFVLVRGKVIPLIFQSDFQFGFPNMIVTGGDCVVYFSGTSHSEGNLFDVQILE